MTLKRLKATTPGNSDIVEILSAEEEKKTRNDWYFGLKQSLRTRVIRLRDNYTHKDLLYNNMTFKAHKQDITNIFEVVSLNNASLIAMPIVWTLKNGNTVDLNESDIKAIATQLLNRKQANYNHARNLIDLIESAQNMDELKSIDINSGWTN